MGLISQLLRTPALKLGCPLTLLESFKNANTHIPSSEILV